MFFIAGDVAQCETSHHEIKSRASDVTYSHVLFVHLLD